MRKPAGMSYLMSSQRGFLWEAGRDEPFDESVDFCPMLTRDSGTIRKIRKLCESKPITEYRRLSLHHTGKSTTRSRLNLRCHHYSRLSGLLCLL